MSDTTKSTLSSNELAFPRGGNTKLTPLEVKEISNEATKDVLFEINEKKRTNESNQDNSKLKQRKKSRRSNNTKNEKIEEEEDSNKLSIEYLNFKNLFPGSLVFGQIQFINKLDIGLALENNLVGYIPITSISSQITELINQYENESEEEEEESDDENDQDNEESTTIANLKNQKEFPDLKSIFKIGSWLKAKVVESNDESNQKRKRIELNIEPDQVNNNLEKEDLIPGNILQASIKSIEDHGIVLDLGINGYSGFILNKDIDNESISLKEGLVISTIISSKPSGRIINLKPLDSTTTSTKKSITTISSIDSIQPGIIVDALVNENSELGIFTKVFGLINGTINLSDLQDFNITNIKERFAVGNTVKARILAILSSNGIKKLILSVLPNVLNLQNEESKNNSLEAFPVGHIFEEIEIIGSDKEYLFGKFGSNELYGQIHNSNIDTKQKTLIDYNIGSKHKSRVIGFNIIDNLLILSLDPAVIKAEYLNVKDIPIGTLINCEITKVLPDSEGINVKFLDNKFNGFIPSNQMSDIKLIYPEKKFRIGSKIKGRLLGFNKNLPQITIRKSLVNLDNDEILYNFDQAFIGFKTNAIISKFVHGGVIVSFFGNLKAFLPKNEISETFVDDASKYLKLNQVVKIKILDILDKEKRLIVTLKQSTSLSSVQRDEINKLIPGESIIKAIISEKTNNSVLAEIENSNIRGVIYDGQLSDGNYEQNRSLLKKLKISSEIETLVLEKDLKARTVILTAKNSLIEASKSKQFPIDLEDIQQNKIIKGYVKSVTNLGIFVCFTGRLTGLILAKYAIKNQAEDIHKKFYKNQSLTCKVLSIDFENKRFLLTLASNNEINNNNDKIINPIDKTKNLISDYSENSITSCIIKSIKGTQLNVQLGDNLQGRIDITKCFNNIKDIKNLNQPLSIFKKGEILNNVKILGIHDVKNHSYLPITHKNSNKQNILELSLIDNTDSTDVQKSISNFKINEEILCFVNNIDKGYLWVSITPQIKGRISFFDLSNNGEILNEDIDNKFPIGCAIKARVKNINNEFKILELSIRDKYIESINDLVVGENYPGRIIKIKDMYVLVDLGNKIIASSFITDALNNYSNKLSSIFQINDYVSAKILDIDLDQQKVSVSLKTNESIDKTINSIDDLKRGDIVKGFIKNINNNGVYISLGRSIFALARVSDLSDSYLKDWKKYFKINQLVTGKIINCKEEGRILITLKESLINGKLNYLKSFEDLKIGEIYEGIVTKSTDFGVFIKLNNTLNITGLCHRSEISENSEIQNPVKLFGEGDLVKVKILKIDEDKKQLSLGMKASYFNENVEDNGDNEVVDVEMADAEEDEEDDENDYEDEDEENEDVIIDAEEEEEENDSEDEESEDENNEEESDSLQLSTNGFDWTASILDQNQNEEISSSEDEEDDNTTNTKKSKRKQKQSKQIEDKTLDLNTRTPQSNSDFERLILGNPNNSILWMNYMSYNLQLSEIEKAREIGKRALETINYREENEKLNIWIALLNLENSFGTNDSLDSIFKKSCSYMDEFIMYQKLINILKLSEKNEKLEQEIFPKFLKKFGSNYLSWIIYGSYLLDQEDRSKINEILTKALTILPKSQHIELIKNFAILEFKKGDVEKARSLFEGLISDLPKRIDLWNIYLDQEIKYYSTIDQEDKEQLKQLKLQIENLFERVIELKKISRKQVKFFFNKWLKFEENIGDEKMIKKIKSKAIEYVEKNSNNNE
ncbi:RRP5 [Candida pseudojiufengensis]|uniref:RRP5 n=1 Tax=Candida pseudojiufengensis TaxID=497109 RepID=UPI0022242393|nr:RRP5 [Candida pseudojiufengensis]KAI5963281.1 RRP5 [Candida pseudojiufengensis]